MTFLTVHKVSFLAVFFVIGEISFAIAISNGSVPYVLVLPLSSQPHDTQLLPYLPTSFKKFGNFLVGILPSTGIPAENSKYSDSIPSPQFVPNPIHDYFSLDVFRDMY